MPVKEIGPFDDFNQILNQHSKVIVDCFADWCGPCKQIAPFFAEQSNNPKYKNIVFYGSPAKATTRLNYFRFFKKDQYEVIEDNLLKVGKYIPGINIKIISGIKIKNKFDCVIVLAWNYFHDIKKNFSSIGSAFYSIRDLESNKFKIK